MNQSFREWLDRVPQTTDLLLQDQALLLNIALQVVFIGGALALLRLFGDRLKSWLQVRKASLSGPAAPLVAAIVGIAPFATLVLVLWAGQLCFGEAGQGTTLLHLMESLALAWVAIRLTSGFVRNPALAKTIATAAWVFAAIDILGLLDPIVRVLDSMSIALGVFRLTVLLVLQGAGHPDALSAARRPHPGDRRTRRGSRKIGARRKPTMARARVPGRGWRRLMRDAMVALNDGRGPFADALIAAFGARARCSATLTFDRRALRRPGFAPVT